MGFGGACRHSITEEPRPVLRRCVDGSRIVEFRSSADSYEPRSEGPSKRVIRSRSVVPHPRSDAPHPEIRSQWQFHRCSTARRPAAEPRCPGCGGIGRTLGDGLAFLSVEEFVHGFVVLAGLEYGAVRWHGCFLAIDGTSYELRSDRIRSLFRCFEYPVNPISLARARSSDTVQSS